MKNKTHKFITNRFKNYEYDLEFAINEEFCFNSGDFVRVVGENGVGKTAFFKSLVFWHKNQPNQKGSLIGDIDEIYYFPQNYNDVDFPGRTIKDFFISYYSSKSLVYKGNELFLKLKELLENKGNKFTRIFSLHSMEKIKKPISFFDKFMSRDFGKFSGGQKRILIFLREFFAIKLSHPSKSKLLIMDEPFNDIDLSNIDLIRILLDEIKNIHPQMIILMSTHLQILPSLNKAIILKRNESNVSLEEIINVEDRLRFTKNRYIVD